MLNKELLIIVPSDGKDYTHILIPHEDELDPYLKGYKRGMFGWLDPTTVTIGSSAIAISELACYVSGFDVNLYIESFLDVDTYLYLGRSDYRLNFGIPEIIFEERGRAIWNNAPLITDADVGSEIPIWLATTPPRTNPKKASMEESVDAQQGITDGRCWQCLCENPHSNLCPRDCISKVRRRDLSRRYVFYRRRSNLRQHRCSLYRVHSPKNLSVQCSKPASRIGRAKLQIYGSRHYETCGTNFVLRQLTDAKEALYA